jgi:hypothetical protein
MRVGFFRHFLSIDVLKRGIAVRSKRCATFDRMDSVPF